jgi:hypothetical protein
VAQRNTVSSPGNSVVVIHPPDGEHSTAECCCNANDSTNKEGESEARLPVATMLAMRCMLLVDPRCHSICDAEARHNEHGRYEGSVGCEVVETKELRGDGWSQGLNEAECPTCSNEYRKLSG